MKRVLVGLALLALPVAAAAEELVILPRVVELCGREARQPIVVETVHDGRYTGQVTEGLVFASSDEGIVRIDAGVALPVADGRATITVRAGEKSAVAEVVVSGQEEPFAWTFRNHVGAVLAKSGCNGGACHGAEAGKNGFKLTLFGYDPVFDYDQIVRHALGRRVVLDDPGRSLVLLKPTGALPHKGGLRFEVDSLEYRVLSEWIAGGAAPPTATDPQLVRLEILPPEVQLTRQGSQQLLVRAHFSDGRVEDVTRWARYTSTDETVAQVERDGRLRVMGNGEGAVSAWHLNHLVIAKVAVPYDNALAPEVFQDAPRRNFIDELILEKLAALRLPPSPPADDAQFLRRVYLDTIGVLPTPDEVQAFLADPSPDKRDRLIDHLLGRSEFVDYWTYKWSDLLLVSSARLRAPAMKAYHQWIRRHAAANTPWDVMVRELVTATGSTLENGAANFFVLHQDPTAMAETVSMAFLGMSINCAKCHNHPLEKWTNDQYYGMANLLARVRAKNADGDGNLIVFAADEGELVQPLTGRVQPARPLDGPPVPPDSDDRRVHLAQWLTAPDNPQFARAIVNRVWANFMGVGLVHPVDDLRVTNPPSDEKLLAALADHLIEHGYDLKQLMRAILQSAAYQRDSRPLPENEADERSYARYYPRRLPAEVILDALSQASGVATEFKDYPKGTRALQLPDSNVSSYFLQTFGRPDRNITCECERTSEPSMVQVLHIVNGETLNAKLRSSGGTIDQLLAGGASDEQLIERVYLTALCRYPTDAEKARMAEELREARGEDRRLAVEDLLWAVLSSKEFLFNH